MAKAYKSGLGARWEEVPGKGESVRLVDVGTHSRGSIFLNGERFHSLALLAAIGEISSKFQAGPKVPAGVQGLCLGRYDLKVPDGEHLRRGEGLTVIEVNGGHLRTHPHLRPKGIPLECLAHPR